MIEKVVVRNYRGEELEIDLRNPFENGLVIVGIDGVTQTNASINTGDYASSDGGFFTSARTNSRNVTLDLLFIEAPSIDASRRRTYQFFPVKHEVTLEFYTKDRKSTISGYVESNESTMFSDQVGATISIMCPGAYLKSIDTQIASFFGETPSFHFAFANYDVVRPSIQMGEVSHMAENTVFYKGEAETGFVMRIRAYGIVKNIKLYDVDTREHISINTDTIAKITGSSLVPGDEVIVSTVSGDRYATLLREGVYTNILNSIDRTSSWLSLAKGDNVFVYTADEGWDDVIFTIEYRDLYEGV